MLVRKVFPLSPKGMIDHLKLRRPIYLNTAAYGHFGRSGIFLGTGGYDRRIACESEETVRAEKRSERSLISLNIARAECRFRSFGVAPNDAAS